MKKTLFISTAVILLLAFFAATLYFKAEQADQSLQTAEQNQSALAREHSPRLGQNEARVQIVEFLDPACETCRHFFPLVKEMMAAQPERIGLTLRYTPLHENADRIVALLLAAGRQGRHWEALEALLAAQDDWVEHHVARPERAWRHIEGLGLDLDRLRRDMDSPEIARMIAQDMTDARALNVTKTPEFFVNGKPLPYFGHEPLKELVDEALATAYR